MDLMQNADQDAIQQTVRSFLDEELPTARVRELAAAGPAAIAPIWRAAGELGFFGLGLPEASGGAGYGLTEEMILFEELGRALAPGPWLGSVLAAHALATSPESAGGALARILAGELRVALVERAESTPLTFRSGRLTGSRSRIPDAGGADALLVLDQGHVLYVPCEGETVDVETVPSVDPTRPVARVAFREARALVLAQDPAREAMLRRGATALSCAEAVGGIQRTVEMSVEYAKVRHQFGKPIGSFQAVKHRCSDMAVRAELARSVTIYATVAVRDQVEGQDGHLAVAKALAAEAYIQNAADNVQNHGGMGFTWECDAHLYVKRARSFDQTLGSRKQHLDALAARLRAG